MKKLLLTLLVLGSSLLAFSQGTWFHRHSLPDSTRAYGVGFSIGNYGYMGLGGKQRSGWEYFNDFWRFNPDSNTWTRMADFPGRARMFATTFVIGNYAYVVTGGEIAYSYAFLTECWQYNALTDTWTQKHDFPGISRIGAIGFAIGGKGYMGTGYDTLPPPTPATRDFWEYDTATDTWTQKNNFPGRARYAASGFAVGGKGYICFGADSAHGSFVPASDMWEYDTGSDTWSKKTSNPTDSVGWANGFVIGNAIYVGTGQNCATLKIYNHFWQYNTTADTWTQQVNYLGGIKVGSSAFAVADTGYFGLGDSTTAGSKTFFRFVPDSVFTSLPNLKTVSYEISVYPNPFNISCTILLPEISADNASFEFTLYDATGRKLYANITLSNPYYILHRDNLNQGFYILSVKGNNQIFYKKLLIIN